MNRNIYFSGLNGGYSCYAPGTDPKLAPLTDNGGYTLTMALLSGSAAVDRGDNVLCANSPVNNVDQRGVSCPIDGNGLSNGYPVCDIGAFEVAENSNTRPTETLTPSTTEHVIITDDSGTGLQYAVPGSDPLDYGQYWWRVRVTTGAGDGPWMQPWMLTITTALPAAPALVSPVAGWLTNDTTPTFTWIPTTSAGQGFTYQIQIATLKTFFSPALDVRQADTTYTATTALADGVYYWRVRTLNGLDTAGPWSAIRSFTLDATPPPVPTLLNPCRRRVGNRWAVRKPWLLRRSNWPSTRCTDGRPGESGALSTPQLRRDTTRTTGLSAPDDSRQDLLLVSRTLCKLN